MAFACEVDSGVTMNSDNPPTFFVSGSGRLDMLKIHGPKVREAEGDAAFVAWEITPKGGRFNGTQLWSLRSVTYGQVPDGYKQVYPEQGEAPALVEGYKYHAFFDTTGANGAHKYFTLNAGKVTEVAP
jgi:hypothetical protein